MEYFPLLELPEEIQALVVERVARNSFQDLYGLKASGVVYTIFTMCYPFPGDSICLLRSDA
ncbi:unnamed protein product [Brassica oleracea]